ncbi:MAG: 2-dehydro-3-deoxy-6-phosphogalactonate aldolase [Candidatus Marinimicrobia bacterium]|nr:2-dehydro-3-deoxy-6-phosphogalactonate aldolase [Candidatus Neomarinimicrobiota bacterium]
MESLRIAPVIAILRGITPETVLPVCEALVAGGIKCIEVTLNSPRPLESIERAAAALAPRGIQIGAGTVLRDSEVTAVAKAGGTYIISPNWDPGVIRRTRDLGLISIPGVFTPSEAFAALAVGAHLLKFFPVGRLGPGYLKDLQAVLPAPIVAVGGVDDTNAARYLEAGAQAVGIGSALYRPGSPPKDIRQRAAALMKMVSPAPPSAQP